MGNMICNETLLRVLDFVHRNGRTVSSEICDGTDLARATAYRYIELAEESGLMQNHGRKETRGNVRTHVYSLSDKGKDILPKLRDVTEAVTKE